MKDKDIHVSFRLDLALKERLDRLELSRGAKSQLFRRLLKGFLNRIEENERRKRDIDPNSLNWDEKKKGESE